MAQFDAQAEYQGEGFKRVRLDAARVVGKEFCDCTFARCSFRETVFQGCKFVDCTFQDCDLSLMGVTDSTFRDTAFTRCQMIGVNWTLAAWSPLLAEAPVGFQECVLDYSSFFALKLHKLAVTKCHVQEADFREADLTGADFGGATLSRSLFRHTNLTQANFAEAIDYAIDPAHSRIGKARFSLPEALSLLDSLDIVLVE